MGRARSQLWNIPKETLEKLVEESNSVVEVCVKLGVDPYNGSNKTVYRLINHYNIPKPKYKTKGFLPRLSVDEIFTENSFVARNIVKRHLIQRNLIPYVCRDCGNTGSHNGKHLSLQLEHINAINNDHRLVNLCFLCPNCHSQTLTYAGKKNRKVRKTKIYESQESKSFRMVNSRKFHITQEKLIALIKEKSICEIGRMFGVSDNAIRKRCKLFKIEW